MKKEQTYIHIEGARENNLKNISLDIPHNSLCVVTGLSGSGKSSLAFNTLYAEGQRRYLETLSAYARQFIGNLERPDVDLVTGLSPVIAIEQKTTSRNIRSTVGTLTEVYDFLRLLYARAATAYSPRTGEAMVHYTVEQICHLIQKDFAGRKCLVLAPVVQGRKGHYKEQFEQIRRKGFLECRIDGDLVELEVNHKVDRYKTHFIEMVIDKIVPGKTEAKRLRESLETAFRYGKESLMLLDVASGNIRHFSKHLMCPTTGESIPEPAPFSFSFNSPQGACPHCGGLGFVNTVDLAKIIPDPKLSLADGGIAPIGKKRDNQLFRLLEGLAQKLQFSLYEPIESLTEEQMGALLYGSSVFFPIKTPSGESFSTSFSGLVQYLDQLGDGADEFHAKKERFFTQVPCPQCGGSRLRAEALYFKLDGMDISQLSQMDLETLRAWFEGLEDRLDAKARAISTETLKEIRKRLDYLLHIGLGYLSLGRSTRSLSGGESQRIRLATQIGSQLVNVLYILDEPSIGLHPRDNMKLLGTLQKLRDQGNTIVVVEHDTETLRHSDWIIDIGPGAGEKGGELLYCGPVREYLQGAWPGLTHAYMRGARTIPLPPLRRPGNGKFLTLSGATGNNLQDVCLRLPLGCLTVVTGVSGSGKSSLINQTLVPALSTHFYHALDRALPYKSLEGLEHIDKLIEVDQSPIGRSPRSNPATYVQVFADIRRVFEATPDAKIRGFKANRFSFNVAGGRCEECKGTGVQLIEMNFLPDVYVPCKVCHKKRYKTDTLAVKYKGKSIYDVLEMTVNQALDLFSAIPSVYPKLKSLQDVGLGYLKLGQSATTLSGGECQRVKLATELAKRDTGHTLYVFDEPTTGLHLEDVRILLGILQTLVDKGNTVLIIEHHPDVIACADYLIDLGPEGGRQGGRIVAQGTPQELARCMESHTGALLRGEYTHLPL